MNTSPSTFPLQKKQGLNAQNMMFCVLIALIPGIVLHLFFFGWLLFYQLLTALITALVYEAVASKIKQQTISLLSLSSSLVTCALLAMSLPDVMPLQITIIGLLFALIFGRSVYGGVGMNIFNPAMVGFCFLYLAFPHHFSTWSIGSWVSFTDSFHILFSDVLQQSNLTLDAMSQATSLQKNKLYQITTEIGYPDIALQIAWALGGIFLCIYRIADWRLVTGFLLSSLLFSSLFYSLSLSINSPQQLFASSSIVFAAWFIITDPTTAATSHIGRWTYAMIAGFLTATIQAFGVMPDGVAFAILLANLFVPLIDTYTKPKY